MRRGVAGAVVGLVAMAVLSPWAHAARQVHHDAADAAPLAVQSSSVSQSGQDIVWRLDMQTPFWPEALAPAGAFAVSGARGRARRGGQRAAVPRRAT